ncbi:MAG: formate/nitrite transporter family protein [Ruminococcus sp.]|nr:formate/nitrite transporter family protein [Ruminococcus sp.]
MIKHYLDTYLYGILGGICIGLGGTAFLCTENTIMGAILFTVGLFTICSMGFNLFTGKVAYIFNNKPKYLIDVFLIWLGNLTGTVIMAGMLSFTRISGNIYARASAICSTKLSDSLLSLFILAIFCNLLIFIAVDGFKNNEHELGKYLGLLFGVVAFIFSGYEHSIADMFYFSVGGAWSVDTIIKLIVITLGNTVGGALVPVMRIVHEKLNK